MNAMQLLDALGNVQEPYLLSAAQNLGYTPKYKRNSPLRRIAACLAAVLLLLSLSFGAAMAVSPDFREFVFSFFRAESPEVVPEHSTTEGAMLVEPGVISIGDQIKGTYVHAPEASHARNGVFLVCTDEVMMNAGNHYDAYIEENGQLVQLEEHTFQQDYTILGNQFHVEFQWVDAGGHCVYTYIASNVPWRKLNLAGSLDATLFSFSCRIPGTERYTDYPVLINLNTGAFTDILAGTGAEKIPEITQSAISEDLQHMVLVTWDGQLYYVNLESKQLYSLDELSGEHAEECILTGSTITCFALEGASIEDATLGTYKIWAIDLEALERRELFDALPATAATSYDVWSETYYLASEGSIWENLGGDELSPLAVEGLHFLEGFDQTFHWGNMYSGTDFALAVENDRSVWVIDLATGEKSVIEGFTWPEMDFPAVECIPSPGGDKLLIKWRGATTYYDRIGIVDYSTKTYFEFSRENLNAVSEHTFYWFDHESILIGTSSHHEITDYYIYRLQK